MLKSKLSFWIFSKIKYTDLSWPKGPKFWIENGLNIIEINDYSAEIHMGAWNPLIYEIFATITFSQITHIDIVSN